MRYEQIKPEAIHHYITSPEWHMQQKLDGMRCRIFMPDGFVVNSNGEALKSTTAGPGAREAAKALMTTATTNPFWVEGEVIGDKFYVFDMLLNNQYKRTWEERLKDMEAFFKYRFFTHIKVIPTATNTEDKLAMWEIIKANNLEGAILKHVRSLVMDGGRVKDMLKCKLRYTADVVVVDKGPGNGRNGTGNWVEFGLYSFEGAKYLQPVGRTSTIGKPFCNIGDVIEVEYLYAGAGNKLVQPTHLRNRPDKEPRQCTFSQLHFVNKTVML